MTPVCSEHAALLKAIAKNLQEYSAQDAYSDWLQEKGNCGWLIVKNYPPTQWPVWWGDSNRSRNYWSGGIRDAEYWSLPWLSGFFYHNKRIKQPSSRIKQILLAYADGAVTEPW